MTSLVPLAKSSAFRFLSLANRPIGTIRLRRDVAQAVADGEPLRIAVGVGDAKYPNWINTDINWPARNYLDLMKPWPTPPVDRIFADNVIEHFTIRDGRVVLANALAALCPGGGIRIATPTSSAPPARISTTPRSASVTSNGTAATAMTFTIQWICSG